MECTHNHDQIVWVGENGKVYVRCSNCNIVISPTMDFELVKRFTKDYKPKLNAIMGAIK